MTSAAAPPSSATARVPAKVNLDLRVGGLRPDGFHGLSTIYQAVSLHDEVTASFAQDWGVSVRGPLADGVPEDGTNLALLAARALAAAAGVTDPVHLSIHKEIPVAGGMAGGSADAAGALVACDALWGLGTPREELDSIAAGLGSDVPFLLSGGTALGSGRGEVLTSVLARGTFHWVLALSDRGLSTPEVYGQLDRHRDGGSVPEPEVNPELMSALRAGEAQALAESLVNDLQGPAISLRPELGDLIEAGVDFGALAGIVSGSGPTIAFLTATHEAALDLAVSLTASGAVREVRRVTGPVHGAHLVTGPRAN